MMGKLNLFITNRKYEILLSALLVHLYIGAFLPLEQFYVRAVWPLSILTLGAASIGIFKEKKRWHKYLKNTLLVAVLALALLHSLFLHIEVFMFTFSFLFAAFLLLVLIEVFRFLIKPSYINTDLISAAACGYFLLLEIFVFLLQAIVYINPNAITGINEQSPLTVFLDLVYFASISITTIGYGDITPATHHVRLLIAFFGVVSQFYIVVLIGILISKFSNHPAK